MTRKELLDAASECVLQDRASQYGGVEDNFRVIATFWSVYLGRKIYPADVAAMMAMLKIARLRTNPGHADSWVDLAGYAACGAECAGEKPAPEQAPEEIAVLWKHKAKPKAEGVEELVQKDAPQTAQELYQRILDCNPASYGHPHKPTGEELAELAQEDAHG